MQCTTRAVRCALRQTSTKLERDGCKCVRKFWTVLKQRAFVGDDESGGEGSVSMGRVRTKAWMAARSGHR